MQTFIEQRQGRARKYARQFYRAIESHDVGFGEKLKTAITEYQTIMEPFIKSKYDGALDATIEEVCDRMNTVRNGIAHSRFGSGFRGDSSERSKNHRRTAVCNAAPIFAY